MKLNASKTHPLYGQTFQAMFISLQLCSAYVLYYDLDWDRDKVIEYQEILEKIDADVKKGTLTEREMITFVKDEIGFDCYKENQRLPYRTKAKMCKVKFKPKMVGTFSIGIDDSAGSHLAFSTYILCRYYDFNRKQIDEWYGYLIDFCELYKDGLTDDHVLEYFRKIAEIDIKE